MKSSLRQLARKVFDFGSGEMVSRLAGIATLLLLAHKFGVVFVGVYALAQGMVQYSYPFIDFGMRQVGVRLIAQHPQAGSHIVREVQKRRFLMASMLLPFLLLYAVSAKLPMESRVFLFAFSAVGCLYAASLDWAAWGKEHLRLASFGRSVVPISILVCLVLGRNSSRVLWWLILGSIVGNLLQAAIFWGWWRQHAPAEEDAISSAVVRDSLAWRRTSIMGLAWLCNMAFNTIDMLMLGVMSTAQQVGLYSASYRIVNQVLYTYYLMNFVLYPQMSRQNPQQRLRMLQPRILLGMLGGGVVIAALLSLARRPVLSLVFGPQFLPASLLLLLLAWAIPLDFLTSYLSTAYIAWGMEKKILLCTAIGAASNIVLNLIFIPAHGATAAAVNTLVSYVIFLTSLAVAGRSAKELSPATEPLPEMMA